jgi:1,4-alpha-glucan branching enzyme
MPTNLGSEIEFKLFAPYNNAAALVACFTQWNESSMVRDEKGYFRISHWLVDGIYQYKFRVQTRSPEFQENEWVDVIDPYATNVDETSKVGIIQVKNGHKIVDDYTWLHDDVLLPQNHELVIYELHITDFSGGDSDIDHRGTYLGAIEKLDYLQDLGINAIELMPVNEYPGDYSWGYKVRHFFAAESSYGSTLDLKRLIDECHGRGIRVIMDGIYNHTDEECPLLLIDRNYWYYANKHYPEDPQNYWGPEFNYDTYDQKLDIKPAWQYIGDVVRFWIQEYHIDGIRFDAVRQLNNDRFMDWLGDAAKAATAPKPFYNIAEHIPDTSKVVEPTGPLDACWHESFRYFVVPHLCGDQFEPDRLQEVLDPRRQGYTTATNVINYLATHDRERLLRELGNRNIFDHEAFRRAKLGAALLLTAMGVPMIWMGEEFGEFKRKSTTVTQSKKIAWPLLQEAPNQELFQYYKHLIALRKQSPALQSDQIEFFHQNLDNNVLGYQRWDNSGSVVVVIVSFCEQPLKNYLISNFPHGDRWQEWTKRYYVHPTRQQLTLDLEPLDAQVFVLES